MELHDAQTPQPSDRTDSTDRTDGAETEPAQEQATASIDLDQPADEVWRSLVDPERLAAWMGAGSTMELSPGGEVRLADLVTGVPKRGRVASVVPQRSIEFVWWPEDDPDQASQVSFTMHPLTGPDGQQTRFTVVETRTGSAFASVSGAKALPVHGWPVARPCAAVVTAGWWWRMALLAVVTAGTVVGVAATTRPVIGAVA